MSGHSHAKTVRKKKESDAQKRGQIFSKMARLIWVAVKQGGANPETNPKLRMAIETAKSYNVPKENIERAIKQASGEIEGKTLEEVSFEAYGPGGIALIIEGVTDNKNRSLNELKQVLQKYNGKLVGEGGVKWMFERKGCVTIDQNEQPEELKDKEKLEMLAIEAGAEDILWHDGEMDVYCSVENLNEVKNELAKKGVKIEWLGLDWKPKEMVSLSEKEKEVCLKFFEALDEFDFVQEIYSNLRV
jgi:YebC/PmpR family DNA-binding regulatory protein